MDKRGYLVINGSDLNGEAVIIDTNNPDIPDTVAEEVVIDPTGESCESVDHFRRQTEAEKSVEGVDVVEVNEEEIQFDDGSEEMSVAIDLAKLSQGHFSRRDIHPPHSSDYVFYTEDGKPARSLDDLNGRTVELSESYAKPKMSYAQLIAEALLNSADGMLTLSEIYQAICAKHPYFRMESKNWQNSIRHNLTLNKSFSKVPRQSTEGRGSYWKLEPGAETTIFKRGSRHAPSKIKEANVQSPQPVIYLTIPTN